MAKIPIAILGATGIVGQKALAMIEQNDRFEIVELAASEKNVGRIYGEVTDWKESHRLTSRVKNLKLKSLKEIDCQYIISALPTEVAAEIEPYLASVGKWIFSNASAMRMRPTIPLMIPEINIDHLKIIETQPTKGKIITNPNCSTVFTCLALSPLMSLGQIQSVSVVTLQAISGAGYPGLSAYDLIGDLIPNIEGEEEKIESETLKILGEIKTNKIKEATFNITASVTRVPILHGHTIILHVYFKDKVTPQAVKDAYKKCGDLYKVYDDPFLPRPKRNLSDYDQRCHIGQIKQGADTKTISVLSLGHNLVRGAAGAALANLDATLTYLGK